MRGVDVRRAQFGMGLGVEPDGPHEAQCLGDPVGDTLIAFGLRAVLDEAEHPAVRVLEIGVAAGGEGAQEVQRRRRLAVGLELPARVRLARLRSEVDVVHDIAAVARQRDAVDRLEIRGAGLGELTGDAADLDDRRSRCVRHDNRHLQENAEEVADVVGRMLAEALGAIPALKQEGLTGGCGAQGALQFARLAREDKRRIAGELPLGLGQRREIPINRRLLDGLCPPAVGGPTLVRHSNTPQPSKGSRLLTGKRSLYKQGREADMPIFGPGPRLFSGVASHCMSRQRARRATMAASASISP